MELQRMPRTSRTSNGRTVLMISCLLLFLISFFGTCYVLWDQYYPNHKHISPDFQGMTKPVYYQGKLLEASARGTGNSLALPISLVKEYIDPHIVYEEASDSVIITTEDKVLRFKTDQLTGLMNEKPFTMHFPVEKVDGQVFLPVEQLLPLYHVQFRESAETGVVIMVKAGDSIQWGKTASFSGKPDKTVDLRSQPTNKAPILADLHQAADVMILGEEKGWYRIQSTEGYIGFAVKKSVILDHIETVAQQKKAETYVPWKPLGGKINLTWEQVTTKNPDTSKIGDMPGLNVISPTWFSLSDGEGDIKNMASSDYAKWAHDRGYQLWALYSNGFEPKQTSEALSTYDKRMKMIKQLLGFAELYHLQGINIDFENVYTKDKDNLVEFIREMTPFLHEQGLVVSMDVTPKSGSEMWSEFYDRPALAQSVDYMMVMAYDEHWASSPVAGSVSSLPWAEQTVVKILEEDKVPPEKLILAVPFYSRVWTEETKDGKPKVSSRAVIMDAVNKIIEEEGLTPAFLPDIGQNYVEYKDGDKLNRIWIEDGTSMKARLDLVKKYGLAGVASWRRGYETSDIWGVIEKSLKQMP